MRVVSIEVMTEYEVQYELPDRDGSQVYSKWKTTGNYISLDDACIAMEETGNKYPTLKRRIVRTTKEVFVEE